MKKALQFILILTVAIGSFLSPISAALNNNGGIDVKKNEARAQSVSAGNYSAIINVTQTTGTSASALVKIQSKNNGDYQALKDNGMVFAVTWIPTVNTSNDPVKYFAILPRPIVDPDSFISWFVPDNPGNIPTIQEDNTAPKSFSLVMAGLREKTEYTVKVIFGNSNGTNTLTTSKFTTKSKEEGGQAATESSIVSTEDLLPGCGFTGTDSLYGCIIQIVYYLFWVPTSFLAGLAGKLMDFFIFYSINSSSYNQSGFITEGWKVVRDIANIAFIFVLLYIALRTILNLGGSQSKKMIIWVVIIALVINFSLFFTKIIVDSGNIVAGVLYNNIGAVAQKNGQDAPIAKGIAGEESISEGLVNQFDPQKIIASAGVTPQNVNDMKTPFLVVVILATIINLFMIFTFIAVCMLFVGRTVGLMIAMIFSPFAFISLTIPGSGSIMKEWSWEKWFPSLISMTFMAPIFIFFLWLIILFLNVGLLKGMGDKLIQNGNVFGTMVAVTLPFLLIIGLLKKAKEVAQDMAGDIGASLNKMAGTAIGAVGGLALGRATIGRGAAEGAIGSRYGTGGFRRGEKEIEGNKLNLGLKNIKTPVEIAREQAAAKENRGAAGTTPFVPAEIKNVPESRVEPKPAAEEEFSDIYGGGADAARRGEISRLETQLRDLEARRPAATTEGKQAIDKELENVTGRRDTLMKVAATTPTPVSTTPAAKSTLATTTPLATTTTTDEKKGEKESMTLKDLAAGGGVRGLMARQALGITQSLTKSSFDLRNTKLMKFVQKQTGLDFGKGHKGGYEDDYKARKEKELKYAKSLEPSEFEKLELYRLDSLHKDLQAMSNQIDPITGKKRTTHPKTGEDLKTAMERIKQFDKDGKVIGGAWHAENSRLDNKLYTRKMSYAKTIDSGTGLNWVASKITGRNTANNVAIGNAIREGKGVKSEAEKLLEIVTKAHAENNPKPEPEKKPEQKPEPKT